MADDERVYYDESRVTGVRLWFWGGLIGALDRANRATYGRVRGFLWSRWHRAYLDNNESEGTPTRLSAR